MSSDKPSSENATSDQESHGERSPNIVAGGDVNIQYGKGLAGAEASPTEAAKTKHRTAIMVAIIAAGATILVALIGLSAKFFGDSDSTSEPARSIEIFGGVTQTAEGPLVIATGDVAITYNNTGITQDQFDQLIDELQVSREAALRLLQNLDEKDVALEERESQFETLLKKYKALEQRLTERDDAVSRQARELLNEGKLGEAEALLKESLAARLVDIQAQRELAAADAYELGGIQELKLDYASAQVYYQQAVELDPTNSTYLNDLGFIALSLGQYNDAITHTEKALSIDREVYGERHPKVAIRLNNLGEAWRALGEYKKAIGFYKQTLSIFTEVYGERHPNVATGLNNLGAAWYSMGEHKKAIGLYEQALSIDREVYGERHPKVATGLNNLGAAWYSMGEHKKATGLYEQALSIFTEVLGKDHPYSQSVANTLMQLRQEVAE